MPISFARRDMITKPSYEAALDRIAGADHWHLQEQSGAVALATNDALTVPDTRSVALLTYGDYVAGANWANSSGEIARHSSGSVETFQQDDILAPGKTYQATITLANRGAGSVTITDGGAAISANEQTTRTITSTGTDFIITPTTDFDGDIDVELILVQQTNILPSYVYPGAEELNESGASGTATAGNWVQFNNAALTNPSIGVLRVARNGNDNPGAQQTIATIGKRYRITAEVRSDGNAFPRIRTFGGAIVLFVGTTDTAWQTVDVEYVADSTDLQYQSITATGTEYTEWRNLSITEANPLNARNTAMAIGQTAGGNLGYRYLDDGATTYLDVESAEHNSKLDPTSFHVWLWLQKTTWDTIERDILSYTVDANNWIRIVDSTTAGTISFQFRAGGTTEEVTLATGSPTTDVLAGISVAGGVMKAWYRDTQTGSNQAVAGTFVGNFVTMLIGARTKTPTFVHNGAVSHIGTANRELSASEWESIYASGGV